MQMNWKLIYFYSINSINVVIGLLLYLLDTTQIVLLVLLILNCLLFIVSIMNDWKQNFNKTYLQPLMIVLLTIQIFYSCLLNKQITSCGYLLLKLQEMQIMKKHLPLKKVLLQTFYNILIVCLLIYHNENITWYAITLYGSVVFIKKPKLATQQQDFELPSHQTKPTQRNSEVINLIQDNISNQWLVRLQNIPVGIMIVRKDNLQIMFQNQQLQQMFEGVQDISQFLMNELQFKLQVKRKRKQRETSILPKMSPKPLIGSHPKFFSCNKVTVTSQQKLSKTLNEVLIELQSGNLDQYQSKENNLELLAQMSKPKQQSFHDEDMTRSIQCKIFCGQNDQEYLIILDDISLQSYLQKLETREKFQVRIIDSFSHELRTPLNGAKLFLDALINEPSITEAQKINFIYPASNALKLQAYLIRDVVDFTQYHSQIIKYRFDEFQFEDLVQEVNDIFRPICQIKNLGLHINVKNSVPSKINSDFDRIMQILVNIIQNAIKFSEKGLITLEISCYDKTLTFCVRDQGVGIIPSQLLEIQNFLSSFNQTRDFSSYDEWQGLGLLVSQINLFKLAPLNKTQLRIVSNGMNEGTQVTFKIKTSQTSNTTIIGGTIKKASLQWAMTLPDLCSGIQGILIINNPKNLVEENNLKQIPIRHHSSVANYFRPQLSTNTGLLNQYALQETDLMEENETERGNAYEKLAKLNNQSKNVSQFLNNYDSKEKIKRRKQSSFSVSGMDIIQNHKPNTLISRMLQREEKEIQMEEQFDKLQFSCRCYRILSVDDDLFNQRALQVLIGQMGFRLQIAYNGQQAIEQVTKTEKCCDECKLFNFILMDCQMPIMDGWAATKILINMQKQKQIPDIPIIGLTAFNSSDDIERCLDVGMMEVLTKPLKINQLKQVLLNLYK